MLSDRLAGGELSKHRSFVALAKKNQSRPSAQAEAGTASQGILEVRLKKTSGVSMNNSGKFVAKELKKQQVESNRLILIHDDLDLGLGQIRLHYGRGAAGHKGVQSVIDALNTKDFWRLRIGIGRPPANQESDDYVLQKFSKKEIAQLESLVPEIEKQVLRLST